MFHTYKDIFFVPMDDFGIRLLRVLTIRNWQERILNALFDPKIRSYNRGSFTYDAHENGEFQFSYLDGNIWRLFRFREAILNREGKFKIICCPEQLPFLRKYMGSLARFSTVTMENAERVLEIKRKSLL